MNIVKKLNQRQISVKPLSRRIILQETMDKMPVKGFNIFKTKVLSCKNTLMSVLFQKDGDNHGYFQEVCNTMEDLICLYDSPFQHELTDFLFDVYN
jgi:hypothetical protein